MSEIEIEREGFVPTTTLERAVFRDVRISWGAKGLFGFLADLPINWRFCAAHLATRGPDKKHTIRRLLAELRSVGALQEEIVRGERGRLKGKRWILRSPRLWAVNTPLKTVSAPEPAPDKVLTESAKTRTSVRQTVEKSAAKGFTKSDVSSSVVRQFTERPSGVVTWVIGDLALAEKLEAETPPEILAEAVAAVSATGKDPVPGLVARHLARQRRKKTKTAPPPSSPSGNPVLAERAFVEMKALISSRGAP